MWGNGSDIYADFPSIPCFSKDQLEMQIDVMIRWRLNPDKLVDLYNSLPQQNWKDDVIASIVREEIRMVTKQFTTIQTIEQRDLVADTMRNAIWDKLSTESSLCNALIDFEFDLRDIGYPVQYTTAIESKLVSEQEMIQAEFERQRIIILANATAQQKILEAYGEAEAKIINANATREAVKQIITVTGMENATEIAKLYLTLETLKQIAVTNNQMIFFIMMGEDNVPILYPLTPTQ